MPERDGSRDAAGEGEGMGDARHYDAVVERQPSRGSSPLTRSSDDDLRRVGDREVWSGSFEATITDADVEAGEWRRAEQFED